MQNSTSIIKIFDVVVIPKSGTALSAPIDLSLSGLKFSLQLTVAGDGTIKVEKKLSNDGVTFEIPQTETTVLSGIDKTSGPGSDGKLLVGFTSIPAAFMEILITETGASDPVTVTGTIAVQ